MTPFSIDTAAIAGEQSRPGRRFVPLRPGKFRLKVRSEFAPDGGAWPIPTHGPQAGSSIATQPSAGRRTSPKRVDLIEDLPRSRRRGCRNQLLREPLAAHHRAAQCEVVVGRMTEEQER